METKNAAVKPAVELKGYPKLARLMGSYPEQAIFRRFGRLTTLNLMRLQAELIALEDQIQRAGQRDDASEDPDIASYSTDFYALNNSTYPNDVQLKLLEMSRLKLEQYHSLLLKASKVTALGRPRKQPLSLLRQWLVGEEEGDSFLSGRELERTWDEKVNRDLICLCAQDPDAEPFSTWFNPKIVDWYHSMRGGRHARNIALDGESGQVYEYEDSYLVKVVEHLASVALTIIASLLPALAILALHSVQPTIDRIGITMGFTAAIGLFLKFVTTANMREIFLATVTFAAVEVVFIGTANGP